MDPLTFSLLAGGAGLAARAFLPEPKVPDLVGESQGRYRMQTRRLEDNIEERTRDLEDDAARAGFGGAALGGVRDDLYRASDDAFLDLSDLASDDLAQAANQEAQIRLGLEQQRAASRAAGFGDLVTAAGLQAYGGPTDAIAPPDMGDLFGAQLDADLEGTGVMDYDQYLYDSIFA